MYKNTAQAYGSVAKWLHWVISVLIIFMLLLGFYISDWGTANLFTLHKMTGLVVLLLVIARIVWVLGNPKPKLTINKFERISSHAVQGLLYVCILVMPLSGWAMSTAFGHAPQIGSFAMPMPGIPLDMGLAMKLLTLHLTTAIILIVLIALHVAGALKHHFVDRDDVLMKMLPVRKASKK